MAKLFATDHAQTVIDKAVQLHGGDGVRSGHIVENLYRDIRACASMKAHRTCRRVVIARQTMGIRETESCWDRARTAIPLPGTIFRREDLRPDFLARRL